MGALEGRAETRPAQDQTGKYRRPGRSQLTSKVTVGTWTKESINPVRDDRHVIHDVLALPEHKGASPKRPHNSHANKQRYRQFRQLHLSQEQRHLTALHKRVIDHKRPKQQDEDIHQASAGIRVQAFYLHDRFPTDGYHSNTLERAISYKTNAQSPVCVS